MRDPVSENKEESDRERHPVSTSGLHTYMHLEEQPHTHVHKCINHINTQMMLVRPELSKRGRMIRVQGKPIL